MRPDDGMNPTPRIKVVTFDLDDTLWDVSAVIIEAEKALRGWLEANCPAMAAAFDRHALVALRIEVLAREPDLEHHLSELRTRVLAEALRRSGYGEEEARELARAGFAVFLEARHRINYFDHALDTLDSLRDRYQLGILTNGNADMERLGLDRYFSFAFTASSVGVGKPGPEIFEAAMTHTGTRPHEVVHVGDHHENDIRGAQRLGIHTIWVNLHREEFPGPRPATAVVDCLSQIPAAITGIENDLARTIHQRAK